MESVLGNVVFQTNGNETIGADDSFLPRFEWIPSWIPDWIVEFAASIIVIILAWLVARLLVKLFSRRIAQHLQRPSLTRVSLASIRVGVYLFAFFTILRIYGLDLGSIALSVTVFSAVVGVILAPIVGSIISGIFLLADQPYEIGDMIELSEENTRGFVEDITLRYTKIFTVDNTFIVIPNGVIRDRDVINYSAEDTRIRLAVDVLVTYESDLAMARSKLEQSARSVDEVLSGGPKIRIGSARYPAAPHCMINEFADDGIQLRLRFWATEPYRMQSIKSEVMKNIWDALEDANVEIAYPHQHLMFDETSGELQITSPDGQSIEEQHHVGTDGTEARSSDAEQSGNGSSSS